MATLWPNLQTPSTQKTTSLATGLIPLTEKKETTRKLNLDENFFDSIEKEATKKKKEKEKEKAGAKADVKSFPESKGFPTSQANIPSSRTSVPRAFDATKSSFLTPPPVPPSQAPKSNVGIQGKNNDFDDLDADLFGLPKPTSAPAAQNGATNENVIPKSFGLQAKELQKVEPQRQNEIPIPSSYNDDTPKLSFLDIENMANTRRRPSRRPGLENVQSEAVPSTVPQTSIQPSSITFPLANTLPQNNLPFFMDKKLNPPKPSSTIVLPPNTAAVPPTFPQASIPPSSNTFPLANTLPQNNLPFLMDKTLEPPKPSSNIVLPLSTNFTPTIVDLPIKQEKRVELVKEVVPQPIAMIPTPLAEKKMSNIDSIIRSLSKSSHKGFNELEKAKAQTVPIPNINSDELPKEKLDLKISNIGNEAANSNKKDDDFDFPDFLVSSSNETRRRRSIGSKSQSQVAFDDFSVKETKLLSMSVSKSDSKKETDSAVSDAIKIESKDVAVNEQESESSLDIALSDSDSSSSRHGSLNKHTKEQLKISQVEQETKSDIKSPTVIEEKIINKFEAPPPKVLPTKTELESQSNISRKVSDTTLKKKSDLFPEKSKSVEKISKNSEPAMKVASTGNNFNKTIFPGITENLLLEVLELKRTVEKINTEKEEMMSKSQKPINFEEFVKKSDFNELKENLGSFVSCVELLEEEIKKIKESTQTELNKLLMVQKTIMNSILQKLSELDEYYKKENESVKEQKEKLEKDKNDVDKCALEILNRIKSKKEDLNFKEEKIKKVEEILEDKKNWILNSLEKERLDFVEHKRAWVEEKHSLEGQLKEEKLYLSKEKLKIEERLEAIQQAELEIAKKRQDLDIQKQISDRKTRDFQVAIQEEKSRLELEQQKWESDKCKYRNEKKLVEEMKIDLLDRYKELKSFYSTAARERAQLKATFDLQNQSQYLTGLEMPKPNTFPPHEINPSYLGAPVQNLVGGRGYRNPLKQINTATTFDGKYRHSNGKNKHLPSLSVEIIKGLVASEFSTPF